MTVPGGGRRDTFTGSLILWRAAAAIGDDGERKSEFRMGRLPSAFDPEETFDLRRDQEQLSAVELQLANRL